MSAQDSGPPPSDPKSYAAPADKTIHLRTLSSKAPVSREAVALLWRKGLVAGLFNIPTQAIFDACTDFCIESPVAENSKDVVALMETQARQIDTLSVSVKLAMKEKEDLRKQLRYGEDRITTLAGEVVLQEENVNSLKKLLSIEQRKLKDMKRDSETKIALLETKLVQLSSALNDSESGAKAMREDKEKIDSRLSASIVRSESLQTTNSVLEKKVSSLLSRISELESSLQSASSDKDEHLQEALTRIKQLEEENKASNNNYHLSASREKQLQLQVQSLTDGYVALQEEFNQLSTTASRLQTDNFELRHSTSSSDQNDLLNQRLLSHYRYLVQLTEDQESDGDGSDQEAWKS